MPFLYAVIKSIFLVRICVLFTKELGSGLTIQTNTVQETSCSPKFFNQAMKSSQERIVTCLTSRYENSPFPAPSSWSSPAMNEPLTGSLLFCCNHRHHSIIANAFSLHNSSRFRSNSMTCLKRWPRSVMKTSSRGSPPHGMAFWVQVFDVFASTMLPLYFKETKCKSFLRQIHIYGLHRIGKGRDRGAYFQSRVSWGVIANSRG